MYIHNYMVTLCCIMFSIYYAALFFCKGLASHTCTAADLRHMALLLRKATGNC